MNKEFIRGYWRPMIAFVYMAVILFDFIVAPVGWSVLHALFGVIPFAPWDPISLAGGGLFHISIGAILGAAAYTRGKEKIARLEQRGSEDDYDNQYNNVNSYRRGDEQDSTYPRERFSSKYNSKNIYDVYNEDEKIL